VENLLERSKRRWKDNIKVDLRKIGCDDRRWFSEKGSVKTRIEQFGSQQLSLIFHVNASGTVVLHQICYPADSLDSFPGG
jgi:hypothetical protein